MTSLALPNELIEQMIGYLDPIDVLAVVNTCRHLKDVVNHNAERLSKRIIHEERARLEAEAQGPSFAGLDLEQSCRTWMAHYGPSKEHMFHSTALSIANNHKRANPIASGSVFRIGHESRCKPSLVEYLLHLNYNAHYNATPAVTESHNHATLEEYVRSHTARHCERHSRFARSGSSRLTIRPFVASTCIMCSVLTPPEVDSPCCCWIETEVRKFRETGFRDSSLPLAFLEHLHTTPGRSPGQIPMESQRWLEMVNSILAHPLDDSAADERRVASTKLAEAMRFGKGVSKHHRPTKFVETTGLAAITLPPDFVYVPRIDVLQMRRAVRGGHREVDYLWRTRGVRAAWEYAMRVVRKGPKGKLVDPEGWLLLAAVYQELRMLPVAQARGRISDDS